MEFAGILSQMMEANSTTISELARYLGVSRQAVMGWKNGSMPSADKMAKIAEYYDVSIETLTGNAEPKNRDIHIPVIGNIRAGFPVESYESPEGYVNASSDLINTDNLYALRVMGDSMMPIVMEGDIIICDKASTIVNNKICVITVDGESTLKKIKKDSSGITLIPMNPLYPELHYSPKQCEEKDLHIDGVLVEMIRRF